MAYLFAWLFHTQLHATVNNFDFDAISRGGVPALNYALDLQPQFSPERAAAFFIELSAKDPSLAFRLVSGQTYLHVDNRFSSLLVARLVAHAHDFAQLLLQLDHVRQVFTIGADQLETKSYRTLLNATERFDLNIHMGLREMLAKASRSDLNAVICKAAEIEGQLSSYYRENLEMTLRSAIKAHKISLDSRLGSIARYRDCTAALSP